MNWLGWEQWSVDVLEKEPELRFAAFWEGMGRPEKCARCGRQNPKVEMVGRGRREVRDVRMHGKRVMIEASWPTLRCVEPRGEEASKEQNVGTEAGKAAERCGKKWSKVPAELHASRKLTARLAAALKRDGYRDTFFSLAGRYGIEDKTARIVFLEGAAEQEKEWSVEPPRVVGMDEVHLRRSRFVAVNLERGALIALERNRSRETVEQVLGQKGWRETVEVAVMDMYPAYRQAVKDKLKADIVVDKFHVASLAGRMVKEVRGELMRQETSEGKRLLRNAGKVVRKGRGTLTEEERRKLEGWGERWPDLLAAYDVKEELAEVFEAADRAEALERVEAWVGKRKGVLGTVGAKLQRTVEEWREEIAAYATHKVTNARTEALNGVIKKRHWDGRGYAFEVLRAMMLFSPPVVSEARAGRRRKAGKVVAGSMGYGVGLGGVEYAAWGADLEWLISAIEGEEGCWGKEGEGDD
jgi:transposase